MYFPSPIHDTDNFPTTNDDLLTPCFPRTGILLQPQTDLATRGSASDPVLTRVHDSNRGHCGHLRTAELRHLIAAGSVDIDEAIHVGDAEALNVRLRVLLPLRTKTCLTLATTQRGDESVCGKL